MGFAGAKLNRPGLERADCILALDAPRECADGLGGPT